MHAASTTPEVPLSICAADCCCDVVTVTGAREIGKVAASTKM
jgi:hypothetical protein